ncbi:MAG TPA: glycosyltransferase 87 family protein [Streptosporangiaceae bacterium]|nr:glycosyltransferase 87 family protein [Streptosporangiaceae bacterium]
MPSVTTVRPPGRPRPGDPAGGPLRLVTVRRVAPGVLAWAVALAAVAPLVAGYLSSRPDQRMVDLDVYRTGGVSLLHGQPIYHVLTQAPQLLPFTYPPIAAVFAVPLAMMSWPAAQAVWVALIYVPLAVTIWYAFRPLLATAGRHAPVVYAGLFVVCAYLFPLRDQMRFGQVDILLVALCVADCAAVSPRWPRGALVGLAAAVKLVPGVFIVYLWISGRRRAAATAAGVAAAWTLGAFVLLPRDSLFYWTNAIFDSNRLGSNTGTSNQSLRGILLRLFLPSAAPTAVWVIALVVVGAAGFVTARRVARTGGEMAGIAITGLLAVLLSPVAWIHHLAWVVVVIGAVAGDGRDRRRLAAAGLIAVFYIVTLPWWGLSLLKVGWLPKLAGRIVQSSFGLGAIALIPIVAWAHRGAGQIKRLPVPESTRR